MVNSGESERLWGIYLKAKAEFERIAHLQTIMSDEYEEIRERAKDALMAYRSARKICGNHGGSC